MQIDLDSVCICIHHRCDKIIWNCCSEKFLASSSFHCEKYIRFEYNSINKINFHCFNNFQKWIKNLNQYWDDLNFAKEFLNAMQLDEHVYCLFWHKTRMFVIFYMRLSRLSRYWLHFSCHTYILKSASVKLQGWLSSCKQSTTKNTQNQKS